MTPPAMTGKEVSTMKGLVLAMVVMLVGCAPADCGCIDCLGEIAIPYDDYNSRPCNVEGGYGPEDCQD